MRTWLAAGIVLLGATIGCSRREEVSTGQKNTDGGTVMVEVNTAVSAALTRMEATGKLDGVKFEHFVGGGLPPPYYRADQFLLVERNGHDMLEFAAPNYKAKVGKDQPYPNDDYQLAARPEDVKAIAHALREGHAFDAAATVAKSPDAVRVELAITVAGKEHKVVYRTLPPALTPLDDLVKAQIARVKAQGQHKLEP
jgi:hypothetical protein